MSKPGSPQWAMRFDGRYWVFDRDGRRHFHRGDGSVKNIVWKDWGDTDE